MTPIKQTLLLIGGIYGMSEAFRRTNLQETTETLLERQLPDFGWEVKTAGHHDRLDLAGVDVVHIHHLGRACVKALTHLQLGRRDGAQLVFTRHATKPIPVHQRLVLRAIERKANAVVALTRPEQHALKDRLPPEKVELIYNGVDTDLFHPRQRATSSKSRPFRFLYIGQLIELKRVHLALHAVHRLRQSGRDVTLDIISHRPTLRPDLEQLARKLEISSSVRFRPPATRTEIAEALRAADALVLPSRTEASPTVVIEAGLSNLPVVAFSVGGISDLVPPELRLPPVDDVSGFIELARAVVDNHRYYREHAAAFRPTLVRQHSVTTMAKLHDELYRRLLEGGGQP